MVAKQFLLISLTASCTFRYLIKILGNVDAAAEHGGTDGGM